MKTLADLFSSFSGRSLDTAFVFRTGVRRYRYTYAFLHDYSLRMNAWLADRGVGTGDRVVLWGPNSPWWGIAFWGIIARGAIVVPVDFMSGADRADTIAGLTDARLVIQSRDKLERLAGRPAVLLEELPFLLELCPQLTTRHVPDPDDIAELIYTSGTTGTPKGVILTHRNLVANLLQVNRHISIVSSDYVFLSLLPLSHMFEQMGGFLTPLYQGASVVYIRTLKPSAIMEALGEEDVHALIAVPRLLQLLKDSIERELDARGLGPVLARLLTVAERLPAQRRKLLFAPIHRKFGRHFSLFVSGGAPLAPEVFRFWAGLGFTVLEGYGLTECAPVLTANTLERQVAGSVGPALPGVELKLVDGEVMTRGDNVFPGYYRNEAATRDAFDDGWFRTGDLGEFDGAGWLRILGRKKELIVTGAGVNVFPDEIESMLNRAAGVRESCVIGLDRGKGEEVHAVLIPDESGRQVEEIINEINGRLDDLHRITGWSIWPDAEFPKTTTLKIRKFLVKERVAQGDGTGGAGGSSDRLSLMIARITGNPAEKVTDDAVLTTDLGLTSIGRLELVNAIEMEFRLDLEDTVIGPHTRVAELREVIRLRSKVHSRERFRFWTARPVALAVRRVLDMILHGPLIRHYASLKVEGGEHLGGLDGPVLFVSNHLSYFDHPVIMSALPSEWRYTTATAAWEEFFFRNYKNFAQKIWKRLAYEYASVAFTVFPLPQSRGFRGALRFMGGLADRGMSILVFPEGERSRDGTLLPFRPGLGVMVRELAIPVVPVRIRGLEQVFPRGASWPARGEVRVTFGKAIRFTLESPAEIVAAARTAVEDL
ncbi:AMP-binding protein [Geobacter sulfurreducens]|uniref:Acyl-(Acyl carrier protein) ligase, acyl carrier, [acyl-]glycerolphosphate acyltransferase fusion protein n=1 Tax=Geobacter sulfurreducens (strain ATCC 51573 / DSM 12127 / PCA) TaxID=243231 RepID=Q74CJ6_GEOSL|nr:AMP-binding protein [Geobacter sulfurreducens]AAR35055.1 acyl-(acyl carrier protein) ligase, acyl carrier [acyl-]glycerolphosphate acyltransferase fusion protein [Geobacter sulfurreducens PCA]AJY71443.1 AMP-binding protein [Geobacter sulfurreducens]UAC05672.1 AMP-binding protein [Geobacter sulfurreducens]